MSDNRGDFRENFAFELEIVYFTIRKGSRIFVGFIIDDQ